MEPTTYFNAIEDRLLSEKRVKDVDWIDRWETEVNGYLRAKVFFEDGTKLEFAEYVQRDNEGQIVTITYAFHWMTTDNQLICRWDNTPHFPLLANFPFHRHDGTEDHVLPDELRPFHLALDEILSRMP